MSDPFDLATSLITVLPDWLAAILSLVGAASGIAALTPTPRDDHFLGRLYRLVELLALNIGHAGEAPPNRRT